MAYTISDDCTMCGACAAEGDTKYMIDPAKCTDCGSCAQVCPVDACIAP